MNSSKFALWRACFSFCYEDSVLTKEENKWIQEKLALLKFTPEQKAQIARDLEKVPHFSGLVPMITEVADKGLLVNYLRQIAALDGNFTAQEKSKIDEVKNALMGMLDGPSLLLEINRVPIKLQTKATGRSRVLDLLIEEIIEE